MAPRNSGRDDPAARAPIDGWMDWSHTALQPDFLVGVFWGFYRTPEDKRNWPAINAALARCAGHFEKLDRLLEGRPFLLGDALTLADITAGTSLYRYFELEIERPVLPQVERWYRALQQRGAFREHVMIPFGELRGRLDRSDEAAHFVVARPASLITLAHFAVSPPMNSRKCSGASPTTVRP